MASHGSTDPKVCEVRRADRGVSMMTAVSLSVASSLAWYEFQLE